MSDLRSIESNFGSGSESDTSDTNVMPALHGNGHQIFAAPNGGNALTEANLVQNNAVLANRLREYQAPSRVDEIAVGAKSLGFELPAKTKQQLFESYRGVSPVDRYVDGTEDSVETPLNAAFWNDLVMNDPLVAEIDTIYHAALQNSQ